MYFSHDEMQHRHIVLDWARVQQGIAAAHDNPDAYRVDRTGTAIQVLHRVWGQPADDNLEVTGTIYLDLSDADAGIVTVYAIHVEEGAALADVERHISVLLGEPAIGIVLPLALSQRP